MKCFLACGPGTVTICPHGNLLFSSPFDVEDVTPSSGSGNKAAALQRRMSIYSQGTPETPTFKDHSFFVSAVGFLECGRAGRTALGLLRNSRR